jgi:dTDP-4-amino-4,6-dideoxygalactose transaminase
VLLTPSCTDALEMAALLLGVGPGDEVIVPSFTFVSTANAFALFGATPVFADSDPRTLSVSAKTIEPLIGPRTKAIVTVHYGGVPTDLDALTALADDRGVVLIEDNAHGLLGEWNGKPLGSFGALATLSFHETKNFSSGEGGALLVNDPAFAERAEILREKGTNRSRFFRGLVDKYTWVDVGSSYLMADPLAAILCAQFDDAAQIQGRRHAAWAAYATELEAWADSEGIRLPMTPGAASHPAHLFWMWMPTADSRGRFIAHMRENGVQTVFHYQALHESPMGMAVRGDLMPPLPVAAAASSHLVRLPLFSDIRDDEVERVIEVARAFRD